MSDIPRPTDAGIAASRPAREVREVSDPQPGRGRPKRADARVDLTLRVEPEATAGSGATGPGRRTRIGSEALACRREPA